MIVTTRLPQHLTQRVKRAFSHSRNSHGRSITIGILLGLWSSFCLGTDPQTATWAQTTAPNPVPPADQIVHPADPAAALPPADQIVHATSAPTPAPVSTPFDPSPAQHPIDPFFDPLTDSFPELPPAAPSSGNTAPPATKPNPVPKSAQPPKTPIPKAPARNMPVVLPLPKFPLIDIDTPPAPQFNYWWLLWVILGGYVGYRWFLLMQLKMYLQSPPEMSRAEPTVVADRLFMEPYQIHCTVPTSHADHSIPHEFPLPMSLADFDFEFSFTSDLSVPLTTLSNAPIIGE